MATHRKAFDYTLIAGVVVIVLMFVGIAGATAVALSDADETPPVEEQPAVDPAQWIVLDNHTRVLCDGTTGVYEAQGDGRHLTTVTDSVHCAGGDR